MDPDSVQYIDPQGFKTTDYTMDPSDVARLRAGVDISGVPKDPSLYPLDSYINNPAAPTAYNRMRAPGYGTGAMMRPNVTSQPPSISSMGIPGVSLSGLPTGGTSQADAFAAVDAARNAIGTAQTPLDTSSTTALYGTQRARASMVPGGAALFDSMSGGANSTNSDLTATVGADGVERYAGGYTGQPLVTSQDGSIADIPGSKKGATGLATNLTNDSRFRTMMTLNPDNAKRFYSAITGRNYDTDLASTQALQATQNTNQLKLGQDVAEKAMIATQDNAKTGVKKGQIVKQQTMNGIVPGTIDVGEVPLTDLESKAYGIVNHPDGSQSFVPNSLAHKAFGMSTIGDDRTQVATDRARQAVLQSKLHTPGSGKEANPTVGTQQLTAADQSAQDNDAGMSGALSSFGDATVSTLRGIQNFGNGLQNMGNKVINYFGGPKTPLGTPTFLPNNDAYLNQGTPVSPSDAANASRVAALRAAGYDI